MAPINRSPFATMALLMAASAGFGMADAPPPLPSDAPERVPVRDPLGPTPWMAQTLPPLDPPHERGLKPKRRSKAERIQRRRKRKQRRIS